MIKKIIPYILILVIVTLAGIFVPADYASAQGTCTVVYTNTNITPDVLLNVSKEICTGLKTNDTNNTLVSTNWVADTNDPPTPPPPPPPQDLEKSPLEKNLKKCGILFTGTLEGCLVSFFYFVFYGVTSFLLTVSANFFNAIIALTLNSDLTSKSSFIAEGWKIVRDLSNIFFILILLYIAIQTILGLGGHDTKKMIAKVVIVAILINFSMFFTKVVIDSSNILALIFYSKIDVETSQNGVKRDYLPITNTRGEKDLSGGLVSGFKPDKLMSQAFFDNLKENAQPVPMSATKGILSSSAALGAAIFVPGGQAIGLGIMGLTLWGHFFPTDEIPTSTLLAIILISGLVMGFAAYAFFIAGLAFLGRLIELWVLIMLSPFAFMSFSVPKLAGAEYLGWNAWLKRLLTVSFMAPIFMFFLYFIFMLVHANIFGSLARTSDQALQTPIETIILVAFPALVILVLLVQAANYAKKGSGKLGEVMVSGGKMLGGLAGGLAGGVLLGGAAVVARKTIGASAMRTAHDDNLRELAASGNKGAQKKLAMANYLATKSFDFRQTAAGKFVGNKTGMNFDQGLGFMGFDTKSLKDGSMGKLKKDKEKDLKRMETYELTGDAARKQDDLHVASTDRAKQYQKDLEEYRKRVPDFDFKEAEFRAAYEKGGDLKDFMLNKKVTGGSVDEVNNAKDTNKERRKAYTQGQIDDHEKEEVRSFIKGFWREWRVGMGDMVNPLDKGAITAAAGALTGGVGAAFAVAGGGFIHAFRETLNGGVFRMSTEKAEIIASTRKGESENEKLLKLLEARRRRELDQKNKGKHDGNTGGKNKGGGDTTKPKSEEDQHHPASGRDGH